MANDFDNKRVEMTYQSSAGEMHVKLADEGWKDIHLQDSQGASDVFAIVSAAQANDLTVSGKFRDGKIFEVYLESE